MNLPRSGATGCHSVHGGRLDKLYGRIPMASTVLSAINIMFRLAAPFKRWRVDGAFHANVKPPEPSACRVLTNGAERGSDARLGESRPAEKSPDSIGFHLKPLRLRWRGSRNGKRVSRLRRRTRSTRVRFPAHEHRPAPPETPASATLSVIQGALESPPSRVGLRPCRSARRGTREGSTSRPRFHPGWTSQPERKRLRG